jgi:hypothetical protein
MMMEERDTHPMVEERDTHPMVEERDTHPMVEERDTHQRWWRDTHQSECKVWSPC